MWSRATTVFALAFGLTAGEVWGQVPQADYVLDLLTYPRSQTTSDQGKEKSGRVVGGVAGQPKMLPLKLLLVSLDRSAYALGEAFVYEVLIENLSQEPIRLPWSPEVERFPRVEGIQPAAHRWLGLTLSVSDANLGVRGVTSSQPLLGSEEVPGSLQTLASGETALIRVPGTWTFIAMDAAAIMNRPERVLGASVRLVMQGYDTVVSENQVQVALQPPVR